jgi:hypothetical protein
MGSTSRYTPLHQRNRVLSALYALAVFPIYLVSILVPKDEELEIYGSFYGRKIGLVSTRAYLESNSKKKFFISKERPSGESKGLVFWRWAYSPAGLWYQLRASKSFYSHSLSDFISPIVAASVVTSLGYGVPVKKVGFSDPKLKWTLHPLVNKILTQFAPYMFNFYCHQVESPYRFFDEEKLRMYGVARPTIVRSYHGRLSPLDRPNKVKEIIFAPTFRKKSSLRQILTLAGLFSKELELLLVSQGTNIWIHPHYLQISEIPGIRLPRNCYWITEEELDFEKLNQGALVTDYSSVFFEAAESGMRIAFVSGDLEMYLSSEAQLLPWFKNLILKVGHTNIFEAVKSVVDDDDQSMTSLRQLWR